ncbi:hypothetical protein GX553_00050, partial [Candidatus Peribacteria bacterium]|nr:hypothetical protein [Candidatus Peribacteria bacterium]
RGTDIKLGEGVAELGGLCILGTERHEARRIDNQLRGRAGRQGDPGESRFFVSMEDELMRLFGGDRLKNMMERLNVPEDQPLENRIVSRSIESAQKRVEGRNFDIRKHVVQCDDVMNKHREIMYTRRKKILERIAATEENSQSAEEKPLHQDILEAMRREIAALVQAHAGNDDPEQWNAAEIAETMAALHPSFADTVTTERIRTFQESEKVQEFLEELVVTFYEEKCKNQESSIVQRAEHIVTLRSIDMHWMNHIDDMAHLREQVAFSGFAQRDPLIEYKDQGFRRFRQLLVSIDSSIVRMLLQADFEQFAAQIFMRNAQNALENAQTNEDQISAELTETGAGSHLENTGENPIVVKTGASKAMSTPQQTQQVSKIGRNDMCPCGSGKKYKKCCGK